MRRGIKSIIIISLLFFIVPSIVLAATQTETFTLDETKEKHQFIIEGEGSFEVQLELPDGTIVDYEDFDPDKYMYFALEDQRMWVVGDAKKGTYTFHISSSSKDDSFQVKDKESIEQPSFTWEKPAKETISLKSGDSMDVSWKVDGGISDRTENMKFYVKPTDGWYLIPVSTEGAYYESTTITMPNGLLAGTYDLIVEIDDDFITESIDPEIIIDYKNKEEEATSAEVVEQELFNNVLYITFAVERRANFSNVDGHFTSKAEDAPLEINILEEDLILIESGDDMNTYLWPIALDEFDLGEYEGSFIITHLDLPLSQSIDIESFVVEEQVNSEADVTWSIEEGLTSELSVELLVQAEAGTKIQVEDDGVIFTEEEIPEGQEELVLQIPLMEGYRILEVTLLAKETQSTTFARRYQVDHTPPRLEMAHPLPSHLTLDGSYVSGYIEPGSVLIINDDEISYGEDGYFQTKIKKKEVDLIATDESGNETVYSWKPKKEAKESSSLLFYLPINAGIVILTVVIIWLIRKKNKKQR